MTDLKVPVVSASYLTFDICISLLLADAWALARQAARTATGTLARGLRITSAGLALMVTGASLLALDVVFRLTHVSDPVSLGRIGNLLVIPGIVAFIVGVCYPGAVMRVHAARVWARHRRVYRELGPLWTLLHEAFPQDALSRVPSSSRRDLLGLHGVHWRYYRRCIECRDGLVRISPRLAQRDPASTRQRLADQLVAAIRCLPTTPLTPGQAVPVAIPSAPGLDADADELVTLSRELAAATVRPRIPKPRRGTSTERTPAK